MAVKKRKSAPASTGGVNRKLLRQICAARSEAFAQSSGRGGDPPPLGDYICQLVRTRIDAVQPDSGDPFIRVIPVLKVIEPPKLEGFTFDGGYFTSEDKRIGVLKRALSSLYGNDETPEDLQEAIDGLEACVDKVFEVAVKPGKGSYRNAYINDEVAAVEAGEAESEEETEAPGDDDEYEMVEEEVLEDEEEESP